MTNKLLFFIFIFLTTTQFLYSKEINCKHIIANHYSKTAEDNFKKAYCHIDNHKYKRAKTHINNIGTDLPLIEDYITYYKALIEYETGNNESTIKILDALNQTTPSPTVNRYKNILLAKLYTEEKNYDSAMKLYKKLLETEESDWKRATYLKAIGDIYEEQKKIDAAVDIYKKIWIEYPYTSFGDYVYKLTQENGLVFSPQRRDRLKRGKSYFKKSLWREAIKEFKKAGKTKEALTRIGICEYKLKNYNKAYKILSGINTPKAKYWLGLTDRRLGHGIKAADTLSSIYKSFPNNKLASKGLLKAGKIYSRESNINKAIDSYKALLNNYPNSKEFAEGAWNLGWIYYKNKDYKNALAIFTKYSYPSSSFNVHSFKYWSAKTYEKLGNKTKAIFIYKQLASSKKFTYHSFLSKSKINYNNVQKYKTSAKFSDVFTTEPSKQKAEKFLGMGIYELALKEIKTLEKKSKTQKEYFYISSLYSQMEKYYDSIKFADGNFNPNYMFLSFPKGFEDKVKKFSKKYGLDEFLVYSLIREESRFDKNAVSVSKARGLMQLIPPTARETARKAGIKKFRLNQLFNPAININLGCYYFNYVLDRFNGNVPLSLAGYNAGPNITNKWNQERGYLPMDEFVEEIPYQETNFYVKKILRSYGAYKTIYEN